MFLGGLVLFAHSIEILKPDMKFLLIKVYTQLLTIFDTRARNFVHM
jgi:hypothetical protein